MLHIEQIYSSVYSTLCIFDVFFNTLKDKMECHISGPFTEHFTATLVQDSVVEMYSALYSTYGCIPQMHMKH